ncbi:MAG TPA: hypothetical protein VJC21_00005, partial [Candidatus Nanoarchaeia archaeon]|nr:hypothetical protein [Candidatus Nanoarchaeia archaeon]
DCWGEEVCRGNVCGLNKVVTWSYVLPPETNLYEAGQPPEIINCCRADQCAAGGGCNEQGPTAAPPLLCEGDQTYNLCSADKDGARSQDGKYECDGSTSKWKVRCFADTKYWLNEDETQICDGNRFLTWDEWQDAGLYNANIDVILSASEMTVTERNCNNGEDDDKDGKADAADVNDCTSPNKYSFRNTSRFSVLLNESDDFTVDIDAYRPGNTVPSEVVALPIQDVYLCDPNLDRETAKVCYTENRVDKNQVVDSFAKLNRLGEKPKYVNNNPATSTLFLYENEPASGHKKVARITLVRDLTNKNTPFEFPFNIFAGNMLAGQRLVLVLDGEFYLLSYDTTQSLFSSSSLRLTHIPTGTSPVPEPFPGTNWYTFDVLGGKRIAVGAFGNKFSVQALAPDAEPEAYVIPWNLLENYEIPFKRNTPVRITNPANVGLLTVCPDDNERDPLQVKVCQDIEEDGVVDLRFTLHAGKVTKKMIGGGNYAFLFEVVRGDKQVSVFLLEALSREEADLDYDNFIDNMVAGRRLALEFPDGQLYLLNHLPPLDPEELFLSLRKLVLTTYREGGNSSQQAVGSETKVDFVAADGGLITLRRQFGEPPASPPFKIKALAAHELAPIDLPRELSRSFSSGQTLTFTQPNIGALRASPDDVQRYHSTFDIETQRPGESAAGFTLPFGVPHTNNNIPNTLFYYHSADVDGSTPVKSVSLYHYYDLDASAPQQHDFNDTFISIFTGGNELALKFGSSYYLLGHEGTPGAVQFYNPNILKLRSLDGTQNFPLPNRVVGGVAQFEVTEGRIEIEVKIRDGKIEFRKRAGFELLAEESFSGFMATLTLINSVTIGDKTIRMCFVSAYAASLFAKVCSDDATLPAAGVLLEPATVITIGSEKYVLESNQRTGAEKKVFIRKMIQLNTITPFTADDWLAFTTEIVENRKPVFNISGTFFLPSASDSQLQNFGFAPYAGGTTERPRNIQGITPISFNGSIVLSDKVVFLKQEETEDEEKPIEATMTLRPYQYLPDNREKLEVTNVIPLSSISYIIALNFVSSLNGELYHLEVSPQTTHVAKLDLWPEGKTALVSKSFAAGDVKRLTLDGVPVEIKLESIGNEDAADTTKPTVTVKRSG